MSIPFFITFIIVFTVDEVGSISNKYKPLINFILLFILVIIIYVSILVHNISAQKKLLHKPPDLHSRYF